MTKITLSEALELVPVNRSKLYDYAAEGVISTEKNKQGKKVVDVAELERAYGKLRNPLEDDIESETDVHGHPESSNGANPHPESSNGSSPHVSDSIQLLELQVSMLETQLTQASAREQTLIVEREKLIKREDKLVEMLSIEQGRTRQLMLPPPKPKGSFWNYFHPKR